MSENANMSLLGQDHEEEGRGSQYLTFRLAGENYGVGILQVQEIRGWEAATRVPNTPPHLKGVVNLRGNIVPVYDLRLWFGMPVAEYTEETVVIIVRVGHEGERRSMGMVVDEVSDVLVAKDDQVSATPGFNAAVPTEFLRGLVSDGNDMVMLLDLNSLAGSTAAHPHEGVA